METKKIILTRKIQLLINSQDNEVIKNAFDQLYRWQYITVKSANMIVSHMFVQEQVKDFFYLTEDIKLKLSHQEKDEMGILKTSKMNTTYQLLSNHFKGEIPMNILSCLNNSLTTYFNAELPSYRKGLKSLRNYKRNLPMPFSPNSIRVFNLTEDGKNYTFNLFQIPFRTYMGKDRGVKKQLMEQMRQGKIKLCTSALKLDGSKIFLLAAFEMEKEIHDLDHAIIAEASLSLEHPITVKIDKNDFTIGNKEEFLHRRLAIQAARQRVVKSAGFNRGGHGRKRKMKSAESYQDKERKYVDHKLHVYSRRLIDICLKQRVATLILTNQQEKEEIAKEDTFILQNWSYYNLKEKIAYKANKVGIYLVVE